MQTYWDLSERERSQLTEEKVRGFISVELMEKGVLKVEELRLEPEPTSLKANTVFYRIKRAYQKMGLAFASAEAVHEFLRLNPLIVESDWSSGRTVEVAAPIGDVEVVFETILTAQQRDGNRQTYERLGAIRKENERREQEYNAQIKKVEEALHGLWEDWYRCKALSQKMEKIRSTYEEYKQLTSGSEVLAGAFLLKVFSDESIRDCEEWFGILIPRTPPAAEASAVSTKSDDDIQF